MGAGKHLTDREIPEQNKADPANIWEDLKEAAEEVRLHKQGKTKLKTAQELLDEL